MQIFFDFCTGIGYNGSFSNNHYYSTESDLFEADLSLRLISHRSIRDYIIQPPGKLLNDLFEAIVVSVSVVLILYLSTVRLAACRSFGAE